MYVPLNQICTEKLVKTTANRAIVSAGQYQLFFLPEKECKYLTGL